MKKIFLFLLISSLLIFSGCQSNDNNTYNDNSAYDKNDSYTSKTLPFGLFESYLPQETGVYLTPQIIIKEGTGKVIEWLNNDPNKTYKRVEGSGDGVNRREAIVTGYIYTYIYKDLGLKISTPPLYEPYFSEKHKDAGLKRKGNILYASGTVIGFADYMEVFFKDPNISFEKEIRKNHLPSGCSIQTGTFGDDLDAFYPSTSGFDVIYITSKDGDLASNGEVFDKQFPRNMFSIEFVMDPKKPDRYYKISFGDCAPGPCSIFGNIEFF